MGGKDDTFVIHGLNEFLNVPWESMDPKEIGKNWSFGRGGHGFSDETYSITTYDTNEKKFHIWQVPDPIAAMMRTHSECAVRDRVRSLRSLLEMD